MQNRRKDLPVLVFVILGILSLIIFSSFLPREDPFDNIRSQIAGDTTAGSLGSVQEYALAVENSNARENYSAVFNEGETLFDALKRLDKEREDFSLEYQESTFGAYVTGVNNFTPDSSKQFWKIVINGQDVAVGISDYKLQKNDNVRLVVDEIKF